MVGMPWRAQGIFQMIYNWGGVYSEVQIAKHTKVGKLGGRAGNFAISEGTFCLLDRHRSRNDA